MNRVTSNHPLKHQGALLLLSVALTCMGCTEEASVPRDSSKAEPAPLSNDDTYTAEWLADDKGTFTLREAEGDVLLLYSWATWCAICRVKMPELETLHREQQNRGLRVIGVNVDRDISDAQLRALLDEWGITFPMLRDPHDRFTRVFKAIGVPTVVLIDREGIVQGQWAGEFSPGAEEYRQLINNVLDGT